MAETRIRCFACGRYVDEVGPGEGPTADEAGQTHRWAAGVLDVRRHSAGHCFAAVACWPCFWKARPDLFVSAATWEALEPSVPFARLPKLEHDAPAPWDPASYPWPP